MYRRTGAAVAAGVCLLGGIVWFVETGPGHERSPSAGCAPAATVASVSERPSPKSGGGDSPRSALDLATIAADAPAADAVRAPGSEPGSETDALAPTRTHVARDVQLAVHVTRAAAAAPDGGDGTGPRDSVGGSARETGVAGVSLWVVPESALVLADEADFDPVDFLADGDFERATTDAHGDAVLPNGIAEDGLLVAKGTGFGVAVESFDDEAQRGHALAVRLHPAERLEGFVVRGWSDDPVADARLFVRPFLSVERAATNAWARMQQLLRGVVLHTGKGGRFVTDALDFVETTELVALADGFARHHCGDLVPEAGPRVVRLFDGRKGTGRVVRRDGRGIEGALVTLQVRGWFPYSETARATSDAGGDFELPVCPSGPIELIATQKGFGRRRLRVDLDPLATPRFELVMDEEAKLAGSVVDDVGTPLDGANVGVFDDRDRVEVGAMRTQDGGRWWMYWVAADVPLTIDATLAGHRPWRRDALRAPLDDLRVVLPRCGALTGVVLAGSGAHDAAPPSPPSPMVRFRLRCMPVASSRVDQRGVEAHPTTFAEPGGRFELEELWPGPAELVVEADGFASVRRSVSIVPGATVPCDPIVLEPAAPIAGRVRSDGGAALAGATVELALAASDGDWRMDEGTMSARCDATGAFTLPAPSGGFALVVTTADGARHPFLDLDSADFPRDLVLKTAGAIEGVVRVPWRFADSTCFLWVRRPGTEVGFGLSPDRRGRFRFAGLDPGEWIVELFDDATLFETHQSDGYLGRRVTVRAGETTAIELSSAGRGTLHGRVALRGFDVPLDALNVMVTSGTSGESTPNSFHARAAVEPSGAFALGALAPGSYRVALAPNLRGVAIAGDVRADLAPPGFEAEVVLSIEGATLDGRVLGPSGEPLVATLALDSADGERARVRTRDDGAFSIHGVPSGDHDLLVSAPGCADRRFGFPVASGATPRLELRLERAARLVVRLLTADESARPLADLDVRVVAAGTGGASAPAPRPWTERSDADGVAEFLHLPSEELRLVVGDPRAPVAERALRLAPGETAPLDLRIGRLAAIEAALANFASGTAKRGVTCIGPLPDEDAARRRAMTDESGRCRFEGLLAGRYLVVADADGTEPLSATVDAVADATTGCELAR